MPSKVNMLAVSWPLMSSVLSRFAADLLRLNAPAGEVARRRIFGQQVAATVGAVRWISVVSLVTTLALTLLFWETAYKLALLPAEVSDSAVALWSIFRLPRVVSVDAAPGLARKVTILAFLHGSSWAVLTSSLMYGADTETATLVTLLQVSMLAVGIVLYLNLPIAFLGFISPILVPLITALGAPHGRLLIMYPLIATLLSILCVFAVKQNRLFVASAETTAQLHQAHAEQQAIRDAAQRDAAEQRASASRQEAEGTRRAEEARRAVMIRLAERFENSVISMLEAQAAAMATLDETAQKLFAAVHGTSDAVLQAAQRTQDTSAAIQTLATISTELVSSIVLIQERVDEHAIFSDEVQRLATASMDQMHAMAIEAKQTRGIADVLDRLAKQTQLLALNATIEAARAGDAGRGFAVVASEVKSLAQRAGGATGQVADQTDGIAERIDTTVAGIEDITLRFQGAAQIATAIAVSIRQQSHAAQQMREQASVIADNGSDLQSRMSIVANNAGIVNDVAHKVSKTSRQLSDRAGILQEAADAFLIELRAA